MSESDSGAQPEPNEHADPTGAPPPVDQAALRAEFVANGDSESPAKIGRNSSRLDDDVERAFHLLRHYASFVCAPDWSQPNDSTERAMCGLEQALRRWLPPALRSKSAFLKRASEVVGDRAAARALLTGVNLCEMEVACLDAVARATIPSDATPERIIAACKGAMARWRSLVPEVYEYPNGARYISRGVWDSARLVGAYWSNKIEHCPSRTGASLSLAVACRALAEAAHERDPASKIAPAVRLEQGLREFPDWVHIDGSAVIRVLDEQAALFRDVQELLGLFEISVQGSRSRRPKGDASPATEEPTGTDEPTPDDGPDRTAEDATVPSVTEDSAADDRQLIGWAQILPALGYNVGDRSTRDLVKKLNRATDGPIRRLDKRRVIANRGLLIEWWRTADRRAHEAAERRAKDDRQARHTDAHLSNPGVRRDEGFHDRGHPNKRKHDD